MVHLGILREYHSRSRLAHVFELRSLELHQDVLQLCVVLAEVLDAVLFCDPVLVDVRLSGCHRFNLILVNCLIFAIHRGCLRDVRLGTTQIAVTRVLGRSFKRLQGLLRHVAAKHFKCQVAR